MLLLIYFNWSGTSAELKEYSEQFKSVFDATAGVTFKGVYNTISGGWNAVFLLEGSWEASMTAWGTYLDKYGRPSQETLSKIELLVERRMDV